MVKNRNRQSKNNKIRSKIDTETISAYFSYVILAFCIPSVIALIVAIVWIYKEYSGIFFSYSGRNISTNPHDWDYFLTFLNFISGTVIQLSVLGAALLAGVVVTRGLDQQRAKADRKKELTRLSEMMTNTDFYLDITQRSWEIAQKWHSPPSPARNLYRAKLVCEFIELPMSMNAKWMGNEITSDSSNLIDQTDNKYFSLLNKNSKYTDYMVMAIWTRYWSHIVYLEEEGIIEMEDIKSIFREWYRWWVPFMVEYVEVTIRILKIIGQDPGIHSSLCRIQKIHRELFGIDGKNLREPICVRITEATDAVLKTINSERKNHQGEDVFAIYRMARE
jgi:hypothetical protein